MLLWARRDPANQAEFYKTFVAKLLPARSVLDTEDRWYDQGRELFRTIDKLLTFGHEVLPDGAEAVGGEPLLPT
jgi:hypothetical protein